MNNTILVPSKYDGREQAFIKHRLLESYLQKLFMIVGTGIRTATTVELCYVDCFAGPWSDESEKLEGTSISVSLRTLDVCRQKLGILGISAKVRALYVEKEPSAYARLEKYLLEMTPSSIATNSMHGDFISLRDDILSWCGRHAFVFFFVDPKGWKEIAISTLQPLLQRPRSEFLINFAYNFVNRTMSMAEWQGRMVALVGEPVDLEGLEPDDREQRIVDAYRSNLKRRVPSTANYPARSAYVRVLDPQKDRPKYHLVYLTSHPRGVIEFMQISEHVDLIQKQVRAVKRDRSRAERTGMDDMFGAVTLVDAAKGHASPDDVDQYWINYLRNGMRRIGSDEFADILEATNWFPSDFQAALVRLIKAGRVVNLDALRPRPKSPLHWKSHDRLQLAENQR